MTKPLTMSEAELQRAVMDLCKLRGVLVHHCRPALTQSGRIATPIQGDAGFPDLVIVGTRGILYRELKSERGQARPEQAAWAGRITAAGGDYALWRPSDLHSGRIDQEIRSVTR